MNFIKESADKKPIVDTVFAIVAKAKEAKEKYGDENVIDATIGSLYDEQGHIVAFHSVFESFDQIPAAQKAAYADSFRGNPDFRELVKKWTLGQGKVNLESRAVQVPYPQ